ncbi:alpha/beta fold hydrolase [Ottowia sp.]|uniref:alpha/beta hydrolase n=1 Tax=Ottowia sp. TaxID=1898956 RepID=UPI0025DF5A04|nr:alpha/beta fold hydrolase [Ottowia sp.]MBK6616533.1 alpha/beta fold hydrolase [Ottowia sp.]
MLSDILMFMVLSWLTLVGLVVLVQRRVIFAPPKKTRVLEPGPWQSTLVVEKTICRISSSVHLEGWQSKLEPGIAKRGTIIYFGGRKENVAWAPNMSSYLHGWEVVAFNYRGFGGSTGIATEQSVVADGLAIYDEYAHRAEFEVGCEIVVMGRSLGSGIAVRVANERMPEKLVLVSPYASIAAVVRGKWYLLPASLFVRHNFKAIRFAPGFSGEALVLITPGDSEVKASTSRKLAAALGGKTEVEEIDGEHHRSLPRSPKLQRRLASFLDRAGPL